MGKKGEFKSCEPSDEVGNSGRSRRNCKGRSDDIRGKLHGDHLPDPVEGEKMGKPSISAVVCS